MRNPTGLLAVVAALTALQAHADQPPRIVAVLPLNVSLAQLDEGSRMSLEEDIRSIAGNHLTPMGYTVLTGENTLRVLSDNGIDAAKACDASCALDAARELKAEYFLSGSVAKSEGTYVAFIRLFEPKKGQQLASVKLEGEKVRDLRAQLEKNADALFSSVPRLTPPPAAPVAAAPAPVAAPSAPPSAPAPTATPVLRPRPPPPAPPPDPDRMATFPIRDWSAHYSRASYDLGDWIREYPRAAPLFFAWSREYPVGARELEQWALLHPLGNVDAFARAHPGAKYVDLIVRSHREAANAFLRWCRHHALASDNLMKRDGGLDWLGQNVFRRYW